MNGAVELVCLVAGFALGMNITLVRQRGRGVLVPTSAFSEMERTERSIAQREQRVHFVISHYAHDRLLAFLKAEPDVERALEIAHSLNAELDNTDPAFRWLRAANDLLSGLPHATNFSPKPIAFDLTQFQELERRAAVFVEACWYASKIKKNDFLDSMRLASSETPQAATQRIFMEAHQAIANLLMEELQSQQSAFYHNNVEYNENAPTP